MNFLPSLQSVKSFWIAANLPTNSLNLKKLLVGSIAIGTTLGTTVFSPATIPVSAQSVPAKINIVMADKIEGFYMDSDWYINVHLDGNKLNYRGVNRKINARMQLDGATSSYTKSHHMYTWNNKGTKYRVIFKNHDSSKMRLHVIDYNGRLILNRLLTRDKAEDIWNYDFHE
jgi:hypothetical protein